MGRVTIALTVLSSAVLLVAFGKGLSILRGGEVGSHLHWSLATLLIVLAANFMAMVHAAQSDRVIRELRQALGQALGAAGGREHGGAQP